MWFILASIIMGIGFILGAVIAVLLVIEHRKRVLRSLVRFVRWLSLVSAFGGVLFIALSFYDESALIFREPGSIALVLGVIVYGLLWFLWDI